MKHQNLQNVLSAENFAAHQFASRFVDGLITEDEARLGIAGQIEAAGVPAAVAREVPDITGRMRVELTSLLSDMMVGRATGTGGFRKDLDLVMVAGGEQEATAWARQLLRKGVPSKLRDIRAVDSKHLLVSPLAPTEDEYMGGASALFHNAGTMSAEQTLEHTTSEDRFGDTLESLILTKKGLRHTALTKQEALSLRVAYEITAPIVVPEDPADRTWVNEALEDDPMAAYASLLAWIEIVNPDTESPALPTRIDERLLDLWNDQTVEEAIQLSKYRPGITHKLALASIMLMPKPSRDAVKNAVKFVTMAAPGHEWDVHAAALVESWVARECAPFSEFKAKSRGDEGSVLMAYELAAASWPSLARHTAQWHRSPLGVTEDTVSAFIGRVFTSIDPINFPAGV